VPHADPHAAARAHTPQAEYAAALKAYKAAVALDTISDEELAAAQASFNSAMTLFKRGLLNEALELFDEV
jgi:tetratricopeptide (TPR) repeat protein